MAEVAAAAKLEQAKLQKEQAEANAKIKAAKDALAVKKAETEAKLKASLASIELDKRVCCFFLKKMLHFIFHGTVFQYKAQFSKI